MNKTFRLIAVALVAAGATFQVAQAKSKTFDLGAIIQKHFAENANPFYDEESCAYWAIQDSVPINLSTIPAGYQYNENFVGFGADGDLPRLLVNTSVTAVSPNKDCLEVESGEIYLHPDNSQGVTVMFRPMANGTYQFDFQARSIESGGTGVYIEVSNGFGDILLSTSSTVYGGDPVVGSTGPLHLDINSPCFIRVDRNGNYTCDSTAFRLQVTRSDVERYDIGEEVANLTEQINAKYADGERGSAFAISDCFDVDFGAWNSETLVQLDMDKTVGSAVGRALTSGWYNCPRVLTNPTGEAISFQQGEMRADEISVHPAPSQYPYVRFVAQEAVDVSGLVIDARDAEKGRSGGVVIDVFVNDEYVEGSRTILTDPNNGRLQSVQIITILPKLKAGDTFGVRVRSRSANPESDDTVLRIALCRAKKVGGQGTMLLVY